MCWQRLRRLAKAPWRRRGGATPPTPPAPGGRLPDGDTVLRDGQQRWTDLLGQQPPRSTQVAPPAWTGRTFAFPQLHNGGKHHQPDDPPPIVRGYVNQRPSCR